MQKIGLACPFMHLAPGQSIGRYVIESLLGEGGMGTVYRAYDTRLERKVALKLLRKEAEEDASEAWEQAVKRMQREAKAVAALSHPGIVAIYDIGDHEGAPFIAMELVVGQPLRELVGTDLPLAMRWRILMDVARALAAAHEAGFLHRDIKPENILVRPDKSAKVLDFGIARRTTHIETATTVDVQRAAMDSAHVHMTADGVLLGTPAYMAPEQIRGETLDARADQFAWAVVAYEFLSGNHPFSMQKGAMALMASILGDAPAPLENVPEDMALLVMRALAKEPAERWESMQALVLAGEPLLAADEVRLASTGSSKRTTVPEGQTHPLPPEPQRKNKGRFVALAALTSVMIVATVVWLSRRTSAESAPTSAVPSASVMPSAVATAITDLPMPVTNNAEARAAFREGMQSQRDGRWSAASAAFLRARKADPEMAAAYLRYAMVQFVTDPTQAREAFRTALGLRRTLFERDAALYQAFEPIIQREPSDYVTAAQRFEALVARNPLDAEMLFWYGDALMRGGISREIQERAIDAADRCVKIDPHYADCWQIKTAACMLLDRTDEAIAAIDACIAQCDNSIDCLQDKVSIESKRGRCDVTREAARQLAAKDSLAPVPHRLHTEALYFSGASESSVRAEAEETMRLFREQKLDFEAKSVATFLQVGFGQFDEAHRDYTMMAQPPGAPSAKKANNALLLHLEALIEIEQWDTAASIAQDAFERYSPPARSLGDLLDPLLILRAVLFRAGKISRPQYEATRSDWLAKHPSTTLLEHQLQWLTAYGIPAYSKDLAVEALAASQRMNVPVDLDKNPVAIPWSYFHGRALMAVGKPREALPYLERATRTCTETTAAIWFVQSLGLLGMAHEATGNEALACQFYAKVLDRWGRAKQSVTAKNVAEHARKLQCQAVTK